MHKNSLDVEYLEQFLANEAPSFRDYWLANPRTYVSKENSYLLLADFRDHMADLFKEDRNSESFTKVLKVVNTLLESGSETVRDATVISIIDVIIKDDALRIAALKSRLPFLSTEIHRQVANWEKFRRQHPKLIKPKGEKY